MKNLCFIFSVLLVSIQAWALDVGKTLPVIDITAGGMLANASKQDTKYTTQRAWSSKSLEGRGKLQIVQYLAANLGVDRQNKPFTDALYQKNFSTDKQDTTVILHLADTIPFARDIVRNLIAKNKAKHQEVDFVIDEAAVGLQSWGMKHNSFAVIILDEQGKILFAKDGPLDSTEVSQVIQLIEKHVS